MYHIRTKTQKWLILVIIAIGYYWLLSMNVQTMFIKRNYRDANRKYEDITRIVVHSTANEHESADADNNVRYFGKPNKYNASAHFCVDDEKVCQAVDIEDIAWHAGTSWGNNVSIGVEMCENFRTKSDSTRMMKRAIALYADLSVKCPNAIFIRHYDIKRKNGYQKLCPGWFVKNKYQTQDKADQKFIRFLDEIDEYNKNNGHITNIAEKSADLLGIPYYNKPVLDIKYLGFDD